MFEVPNAKRVRRDELYGSSSDAEGHSQSDGELEEEEEEEDAAVRAKLHERLSSLLGLDLSSAAPALEDPGQQQQDSPRDVAAGQEENLDEEYEFRLFSTSSKTAAPAKVILAASDDEDAEPREGAFAVPERPLSYYVVGEPTPEQLQRYRQSALAGADVVLGARKRAWGLERPWRIVRLGAPAKSTAARGSSAKGMRVKIAATPATVDENERDKRKRPGKKRRIATRIKAKADKEKREAADKQKLTKEEHLKEKKKRLNREKKLKRRAKEREQRLAGKGQDGSLSAAAASSEPAGSDSDDDLAA